MYEVELHCLLTLVDEGVDGLCWDEEIVPLDSSDETAVDHDIDLSFQDQKNESGGTGVGGPPDGARRQSDEGGEMVRRPQSEVGHQMTDTRRPRKARRRPWVKWGGARKMTDAIEASEGEEASESEDPSMPWTPASIHSSRRPQKARLGAK